MIPYFSGSASVKCKDSASFSRLCKVQFGYAVKFNTVKTIAEKQGKKQDGQTDERQKIFFLFHAKKTCFCTVYEWGVHCITAEIYDFHGRKRGSFPKGLTFVCEMW